MTRRSVLGLAATTAAAGAALTVGTRSASANAADHGDELPSGTYRIDMHAHFLPPEYHSALLSHGFFTIGGYPTPPWSPEAALAFMDTYGIQAQALSVSDPGVSFLRGKEAADMARYCNSYAADLFATHPTRFGAFAVLPMPDIVAALIELEYALDVLHLDGITLLSAYDGVYLGDPRFEPIMAELDRRRAFVFIHPAAIPGDAKPALPLPDFLQEFTFDTTRAASLLMASGTMNRYPNIRFQLAHAGGTVPFLSHRLALAADTPIGELWPADAPRFSLMDIKRLIGTFFYDTALSASPAAMRSVLAVTDRTHIVFGSDWPFSALTFSGHGSGDPAPGLSEVFSARERLEIERINPLRQLPRLSAAVG